VKYIEELTERMLPPTREMVQNYASDIAGHPVSKSWVLASFTDTKISLHPNGALLRIVNATLLTLVMSTRCTLNSWVARLTSTK
jgi:hypothetical protein